MKIISDLEKIVEKYIDGKKVAYYGTLRIPHLKEEVVEPECVFFLNEFSDEKLETLLPGGCCIVVYPNSAWFKDNPEGKEWEEIDGGYRLISWRHSDGKVEIKYVEVGKYEYEGEWIAKDAEELRNLLSDHLEDLKIFSNIEDENMGEDTPWLIAIGVKPLPEVEETVESEAEEGMEEISGGEMVGTSPTVVRKIVKPPEYIKIVWIDSNKKPHEYEVRENFIMGRGRGDIIMMFIGERKVPMPMMLFDPEKKVSRRHIEIVKREDGWYIRDLGSTNGTMLNGTLLEGWKKPQEGRRFPSEYKKLEDNDEIVLANTATFTVRVPEGEIVEEPVEREVSVESPEEEPVVEPKKVEKKMKLYISWVDGNLMKQELEVGSTIQIGSDDRGILRIITREGKRIPMGLIDEEGEVEEKHFEILKIGGKWFIRDLGSRRGTYLNGKPLEGWKPGVMSEPVEIKNGDEILFGKYMITVIFK